MSSVVGLGQSRPVSAQVDFRICRCRAESAQGDVERSQPGVMLRGVNLGRCRAESTQVNVEQSQPRLMSIRVARADVDRSRSGPMSS